MLELWLYTLVINPASFATFVLAFMVQFVWTYVVYLVWENSFFHEIRNDEYKPTWVGGILLSVIILFPCASLVVALLIGFAVVYSGFFTKRFERYINSHTDRIKEAMWKKVPLEPTVEQTGPQVSPIRYAMIDGSNLVDMRENVRNGELPRHGDVRLIWINEGDLLGATIHGVMKEVK